VQQLAATGAILCVIDESTGWPVLWRG